MKIKLKLFSGVLAFVVVVILLGTYIITEFNQISHIESEIKEAKEISKAALDFNVENFHTQLEVWEYAYIPNQERLDAFESHKVTLNNLLNVWQIKVLNSEENPDVTLHASSLEENPDVTFHALYSDATNDMSNIAQNLKLVQDDWKHLFVAIEEYSTAIDEGDSETELNRLDLLVIEKVNSNEALFDKLQFDKQVDLFVTNQENHIDNLEVSRGELVSKFTTILFSIIITVVITVLVLGYLISESILIPIKKLKEGSESLSKEKFSLLEVSGNDELTDLTRSFNNMASTIQSQFNKLAKVNKQLIEKNKVSSSQTANAFQRFVLQNQLATSNAELESEKKFRMQKDEFAAMVSHELKTPIFPIILHCEMLKDPSMLGNLSPDQLDSVIQIEKMATRLDSLTGDILDAQKLGMRQMKFTKTKFKIDKFLTDVIKDNTVLIDKKNISLEFSSEDLEIFTDRDRLFQVFTNLIRNSVVYVKKNTGKIQINATSQNEDILFSIKDNGIGIASDKISNLFRKFYQVDTTLKRKHDSGTGLGLVICKGLVEGLGGKIWVESKVNKGTSFYFTIPVKAKSYNYITGVRNPLLINND